MSSPVEISAEEKATLDVAALKLPDGIRVFVPHETEPVEHLPLDVARQLVLTVALFICSEEREKAREALKAEAKHLRKLARQYDQPTRYELQEASRRVERLLDPQEPKDQEGGQ
jgi:hypothetical protein